MDGWMDGWMDTDEWVDGIWLGGCLDGRREKVREGES